MILYTEDEEQLDDIEDDAIESGYGLKEYLAEEEAYTKFIKELIKQHDNGKEEQELFDTTAIGILYKWGW